MTFDEACRTIESEFAVALGSPQRVAAACAVLQGGLHTGLEPRSLIPLTRLLNRRSGEILRPLFGLLEEAAGAAADPLPILAGLLEVRDAELCRRALDRTLELAEGGWLGIDAGFASVLAEKVEAEESWLREAETLNKIGRILRRATVSDSRPGIEPRVELYLHGASRPVRRLAARLLDLEISPPAKRMEAMLGIEAYRFLAPYLAYAQATHLDLLELAGDGEISAHLLADFTSAEVILGERLLRDVIVAAGWSRLNLGLEVYERIGLSVEESFPLAVAPAEAVLIESCAGVRRAWTRILVLAHGGNRRGESRDDSSEDPVRRFRAYNLAHAEALGEILSLGPLSVERVGRIVGMMDRIVDEFVALFAAFDEEAAALPGVYAALRGDVLAEVAGAPVAGLSAHVTRLVQMFEDPRSLAEVRTLHGLKRYLHQKGLKLGFRLVETVRATNRTVDLLLVGSEKVQTIVRKIQYVEFEPEENEEGRGRRIPYAVGIVAEGMGRHLLHEVTTFPDVKIFCYGNEVHYYASYGTHPMFLRIDFAPPARGGMVDLEYYGVSKHDLDHHPAPDLDAVRLFFRGMDYDCEVARTRVHARYDKERARDLGDLCAKAEGLFRLLPLLMDVDWVIGSLRLDEDARAKVAGAWSQFFLRWGVLPMERFLTADRIGILTGIAPDPAGGKEIAWSGRGPYRDRFPSEVPARLIAEIREALEGRGLSGVIPFLDTSPGTFGQLGLERDLLLPLRDAVARGELLEGPTGFAPAVDRFRAEHEAEMFAMILEGADAEILRAAELARLVEGIERSLRFRMMGSVNGYEVDRADLELRGEIAAVFVLRDRSGMARLAVFAREGRLFSSRPSRGAAWRSNAVTGAAGVVPLLRRANYLAAGATTAAPEDAAALRELISVPNPLGGTPPVPGERILPGVRAAPGKVAGPAVLGTRGRVPGDVDGAILVAATVQPDDNAFIHRSAGIVSTGGGILSHAGLLALQFHKPALVIDARWDAAGRSVIYRAADYEEVRSQVGRLAVVARKNAREREERIVEGDILDLDVERGLLRNLGHEPDALALHEGLRQMMDAARSVERAADDAHLLALRGQRLRARHQLERLFRRLRDPNLVRHAVRELFIGAAGPGGARGEIAELVALLLKNRDVAGAARTCIATLLREMEDRNRTCAVEARDWIPTADHLHEVLSLRLEALRARDRLRDARGLAAGSGLAEASTVRPDQPVAEEEIDESAGARLVAIRERMIREMESASVSLRRHLLRRIETLDSVLDAPEADREPIVARARELGAEDGRRQADLEDRPVLFPLDGGLELSSLIGMKAANLAEIGRILGAEFVPDWYVVTDAALREVLDLPVESDGGHLRLRDAIESILGRDGADESQKSALIGKLWEGMRLPDRIEGAIGEAYRRLGTRQRAEAEADAAGEEPFVAVRSSGREEDTEGATRAGSSTHSSS